jgi:hypothetical protein
VGTSFVGEERNFILWIGLHQLITMRAGIICNRDANGTNAWVGLQTLKRHGGGGELGQIGMTIDASKCIIGGGSVTFGTGSHNVLREFWFYFTALEREIPGLLGFTK